MSIGQLIAALIDITKDSARKHDGYEMKNFQVGIEHNKHMPTNHIETRKFFTSTR